MGLILESEEAAGLLRNSSQIVYNLLKYVFVDFAVGASCTWNFNQTSARSRNVNTANTTIP